MGAWWNVEVGGQAIPLWGKSYVPDELMLVFTGNDRFMNPVKAAECEARADDPEFHGDISWQTGLVGYTATAGALRKRLELQGFSSDWVCQLSTAFFDEHDENQYLPPLWPQGRSIYPSGAAITAKLTTRSGRAAGHVVILTRGPGRRSSSCTLNESRCGRRSMTRGSYWRSRCAGLTRRPLPPST